MKKIFFTALLVLMFNFTLLADVKTNSYIYNTPDFSVKLPKDFKVFSEDQTKAILEQHETLVNRDLYPFDNIYFLKNKDKLIVIQTFKNASPFSSDDKLKEMSLNYQKHFNLEMKKRNKNYFIKIEKYSIFTSGERKFYVFFGSGEHFISDARFIQISTYLKGKRYIIYVFSKKRDTSNLEIEFLPYVLTLTPKKEVTRPKAKGVIDFLKDLVEQRWFRYLVIFVIAVIVTLLYNKYKKNQVRETLSPTKRKYDKKN